VQNDERAAAGALSGPVRATAAGLGLGACALLALAVWLPPDARGLGTHQQLGLPPCSFRALFGLPCPTCGMTTAWSCLVRGQVAAACRANLGGAALGATAILAVPWLLAAAVAGRWLVVRPTAERVAWWLSAVTAAALAHWAWRLATGNVAAA